MKRNRAETDWTPLVLCVCMVVMWAVLHAVTGISFGGTTPYSTYTLQAMAWRNGHMWVENLPHLELAIYEGQYYVSFPPFPSVIEWVLTFFFGAMTPDNLLVKLYTMGACLMMYFVFKRADYSRIQAALGAFFLTFSSSLLPLTLEGAVWYHAQTLAFFLVTAAICLMMMDKPTPGLFLFALSVACRPFNAVYGFALILIYVLLCMRENSGFSYVAKRLWKGIVLGLCVAAALGAYNWARFKNPFEFGHNYLPEFSFQGGIQFSFSHIWKNMQTFLFGLPFHSENGVWHLNQFGFSMLIACPALLLLLIWAVQDVIQKKMTWGKAIILICFFAQLTLLLMHRTFGGFQFGARYTADLIPYAFFYQLMRRDRNRFPVWQLILLGAGFIFCLYGAVQMHL